MCGVYGSQAQASGDKAELGTAPENVGDGAGRGLLRSLRLRKDGNTGSGLGGG